MLQKKAELQARIINCEEVGSYPINCKGIDWPSAKQPWTEAGETQFAREDAHKKGARGPLNFYSCNPKLKPQTLLGACPR